MSEIKHAANEAMLVLNYLRGFEEAPKIVLRHDRDGADPTDKDAKADRNSLVEAVVEFKVGAPRTPCCHARRAAFSFGGRDRPYMSIGIMYLNIRTL